MQLWAEDEARRGLKPVIDKTSMGAGRREAHRPLQEGLQVDLPLYAFLCTLRERRGLLADCAHGKHRALLDGAQ